MHPVHVGHPEHLEPVVYADELAFRTVHELCSDRTAVEPVELVLLRPVLFEWLVPAALEVDGVGDHSLCDAVHRSWSKDRVDQVVR